MFSSSATAIASRNGRNRGIPRQRHTPRHETVTFVSSKIEQAHTDTPGVDASEQVAHIYPPDVDTLQTVAHTDPPDGVASEPYAPTMCSGVRAQRPIRGTRSTNKAVTTKSRASRSRKSIDERSRQLTPRKKTSRNGERSQNSIKQRSHAGESNCSTSSPSVESLENPGFVALIEEIQHLISFDSGNSGSGQMVLAMLYSSP